MVSPISGFSKCILYCLLQALYLTFCCGVNIRRNILHLTHDEQVEFFHALKLLKSEINPATNISTYDKYTLLHGTVVEQAHHNPTFWPWHRKYLADFEYDMQRVSGNPQLTIPYWDWSNNATRLQIFTPELLGGNGTIPGDHVVKDGWFNDRVWTVTVDIRGKMRKGGIQRALGIDVCYGIPGYYPQLPERPEVYGAMALPVFYSADEVNATYTFDVVFEENGTVSKGEISPGCRLHAAVHQWVGGDMVWAGSTVNDPIFWIHHAFIDKVWQQWINWHYPDSPTFGYLPVSGDKHKGWNLYDRCLPFKGTNYDYMNMTKLGYTYEVDDFDAGLEVYKRELAVQRANDIRIAQNRARDNRTFKIVIISVLLLMLFTIVGLIIWKCSRNDVHVSDDSITPAQSVSELGGGHSSSKSSASETEEDSLLNNRKEKSPPPSSQV